ncbi:MAG TPA: RagB/SusD family nutrient uptake outer membrane protein, partial [Pedobacter sp.]
ALFHRGRNFYELSQVFAPPYLPSTAASELGIPLRLESDVNIPSKRSTLQQTYDQILADLKEAEGLLPNSALYITRPSKNATDALLARIYLSMEDYPNALLYADKSLKLSSALIDFNTISPTASPLLPVYAANPEMLIHSSIGGTNTAMFVDRDFYDSYAANDLRKTIYYTDNVTSVVMRATYFYTSSWDGLANDEMYLIRAEAYARTGKPTEAMADLNTLLKNRYVNTVVNPYMNRTAASADDALVQILTERRKELNRRGLRWSDLRRLNHDDRFKTTITHVLGGKTYTLEPNSYKYTFPIPDDIIVASGIQQNKGW